MRMLATLAALATTAMPVVAQDCPTGTDLENGIRFHVDDDATETFTRLSKRRVQSDYGGDGYVSRTILLNGLYLSELVDVEAGRPVSGTRSTYEFPMTPDGLPVPVPGLSFSTTVAVDGPEGREREEQTYAFGRTAMVNFGACAYEMIPVDLTYPGSDVREVLHYLPDLGIAYVAEYHDDAVHDRYAYHRIEAVK